MDPSDWHEPVRIRWFWLPLEPPARPQLDSCAAPTFVATALRRVAETTN